MQKLYVFILILQSVRWTKNEMVNKSKWSDMGISRNKNKTLCIRGNIEEQKSIEPNFCSGKTRSGLNVWRPLDRLHRYLTKLWFDRKNLVSLIIFRQEKKQDQSLKLLIAISWLYGILNIQESLVTKKDYSIKTNL